MDEQALIQRALRGDAAAFEQLVTPYLAVAYRTAYLITRSDDGAQEAVQEGLIEVYQSLGGFRPGAPFRPWFMKIVVHRALNQHRRGRKLVPLDEAPELVSDPGESPESGVVDAEHRESIWNAVQELAPDHRAVVVLHYYQDFSVSDIAAMLEIAEGTVKSRLHTARRRIGRTLEAESPNSVVPQIATR